MDPIHRLSEAESIVSRSDPGGVQRSASSGSGALTGDAALAGAAGRADSASDRILRALERCRVVYKEFSNRIEDSTNAGFDSAFSVIYIYTDAALN